MNSKDKLAGLGLLTALSASLCCITPVLALLAGTSSLATTFSWLDPFRPYFIGLTVLVLGFAWYHKFKPKTEIGCTCEADKKQRFIQGKKFLSVLTIFAVVTLAFPFYAHIFYPMTQKQVVVVDNSNIQKVEFKIEGMTCTGCEEHVNQEVEKLDGILTSTVSYEDGNAFIEFDRSRTNIAEIEMAIKKTGYLVIEKKKD